MSRRIRADGRDREHRRPGRPHLVRVRLGEDEYADVAAAARASGLTPTGYAAEAALAAARASSPPDGGQRDVVIELMAARAQLRRYGTNLNQVARVLNAGGEPPEWLDRAVIAADRVVQRIDHAMDALTRSGR